MHHFRFRTKNHFKRQEKIDELREQKASSVRLSLSIERPNKGVRTPKNNVGLRTNSSFSSFDAFWMTRAHIEQAAKNDAGA